MTTQTVDKYSNHLFSQLLRNLTVLQEDIVKLNLIELDLQASLASVQSAKIKGVHKAYWAIYTIAEHLKRPALCYPDKNKTWFRDLWFYYSVTQIEAEMTACMALVAAEFEVAIQNDASFQLAVTYWQLLQLLNPKCCEHTEHYLEIMYQSSHNWRDKWGTTVARIQHELLQYFLVNKLERRQILLNFLPETHLFREILIRPDLCLKDTEQAKILPNIKISKCYERYNEELIIKRNILEYLRGLSMGHLYQNPTELESSLNSNQLTLIDIFSSQLIPVKPSSDFPVSSDDGIFFDLDTQNKAAFVFDGICGCTGSTTPGENYVNFLMKRKDNFSDTCFSYTARNKSRYNSYSNPLVKQKAYKDDAKKIINAQLKLISEESELLSAYREVEANYNDFQANQNLIHQHIQILTNILKERQNAIECNTNWTEPCERYDTCVREFDWDSKIGMLNTLRSDIQGGFEQAKRNEQKPLSYKQDLNLTVSCSKGPILRQLLSKCDHIIKTLDADLEAVKKLYEELSQANQIIKNAEQTHQQIQNKFLMKDYRIHLQTPYFSMVALLAGLVISTLFLSILSAMPLFSFLVMPVITKCITVLAALGMATSMAVVVQSGRNVMRYMTFPPIQEHACQEMADKQLARFCN